MIARTLALGIALLVFTGCNRGGDAPHDAAAGHKPGTAMPASSVPETPHASAKQSVYTCVMHPEVISDKPGKCPKCGMELVLKQPSSQDAAGDSSPMGPMHSH